MSSNYKPDLDLEKLKSAVNLGSVGNRYPNKKFAIICSEWNTEIINRLLDGAYRFFEGIGIKRDDIFELKVKNRLLDFDASATLRNFYSKVELSQVHKSAQ